MDLGTSWKLARIHLPQCHGNFINNAFMNKNMWSFKYAYFVAVLFILFLCSCSGPPEFILYNNTDYTVTISSEGKEVILPSKEQRRVLFPAETKNMIIRVDGQKWLYRVNYPPKAYLTSTGLARIQAQLENDGNVYIGIPSSVLPFDDLPEQPEGYPLVPEN